MGLPDQMGSKAAPGHTDRYVTWGWRESGAEGGVEALKAGVEAVKCIWKGGGSSGEKELVTEIIKTVLLVVRKRAAAFLISRSCPCSFGGVQFEDCCSSQGSRR